MGNPSVKRKKYIYRKSIIIYNVGYVFGFRPEYIVNSEGWEKRGN